MVVLLAGGDEEEMSIIIIWPKPRLEGHDSRRAQPLDLIITASAINKHLKLLICIQIAFNAVKCIRRFYIYSTSHK
jgi:hypothetical protein